MRRMTVTIEERPGVYGPDYWIVEEIELLDEGAPTKQGPFDTPAEAFEHLGFWMNYMYLHEQVALMEEGETA